MICPISSLKVSTSTCDPFSTKARGTASLRQTDGAEQTIERDLKAKERLHDSAAREAARHRVGAEEDDGKVVVLVIRELQRAVLHRHTVAAIIGIFVCRQVPGFDTTMESETE